MSSERSLVERTERIAARTAALLRESEWQIHRSTDRMFGVLITLQWLGQAAVAAWLSEAAWHARGDGGPAHIWVALFVGACVVAGTLLVISAKPGAPISRYTMAVAQMMMAALLIHLMGGRIEAHFQSFGILAFLALYRDWRVLLTATLVVAADHAVRGALWPESIFGVAHAGPWRWLEHVGWVLFEDIVLLLSIRRNRAEMLGVAQRRAELEETNVSIELTVEDRTHQLRAEIVSRRTQEEELARARDAALESSRLKAAFLATMSHEIRTPMNGIIGMTGLLLDTQLQSTQREYVDTIRSCGESLLTIVNDILDFSKIEAGKLSFEVLDFDLLSTVEGVIDLLGEQAQVKHLDLVQVVHPEVPIRLRGDPGRLRQVLLNLVGNALKFTERGDVEVHVTLDHDAGDDVMLRFTVQDTGIGISEEGCRSLFQPFLQADGSMTRRYGGTGLGLAISKQLVEMMGGRIGVSSQPNAGSTFWFTARFEQQPLRQQASPPHGLFLGRGMPYDSGRFGKGRPRVLIVDDNAASRRALALQLGSWGLLNEQAADASAALLCLRHALLQEQPFAVALIDRHMPGGDGLDLARRIRQDAALAPLQIILLTLIGDPESEEALRAVGVAGRLKKPVRQSRLQDAVMAIFRPPVNESGQLPALPPGATGKMKTLHRPTNSGRISTNILVAEDNSVNQKILLRQLAKLQYRADAVGNGLEVIAAVQRVPYDVILMDCQMPEMDGYTAAREIRKWESSRQRHVHIIALTAHTMKGDREKCLAAGMDDHIGKPVDIDELGRKLHDLFSVDSGAMAGDSKADVSAEPELIDLAALQAVAEGDPAFLRELVRLYLTQSETLMSGLRVAVSARAAADVERIAHTLAGSSMAAGMQPIVPGLRELESRGRQGQVQATEPILQRIEQQYAGIRRVLEQHISVTDVPLSPSHGAPQPCIPEHAAPDDPAPAHPA